MVVWLIMTVALTLTHESLYALPFAALATSLVIVILYRYGLLALISTLFFVHLMIFFPITSDFSAWYAADYVLALIISLGLVVFGFYTSLSGEPLFRGTLPDD